MPRKNGASSCLYLDASNLYGAISELMPAGYYFDFGDLLRLMEADIAISKIKAYGTYLADKPDSSSKDKKFIGAQNKFFQSIRKVKKAEFHKGYFSPTSGKEKGMDVKLAVDMVKDAYEGIYDCAIIMSGDDDYLYAIQCLRRRGVKVHLMALANRFPYGIAHNTDQRFVYDYQQHFKRVLRPNLKRIPKRIQLKEVSKLIKIRKI